MQTKLVSQAKLVKRQTSFAGKFMNKEGRFRYVGDVDF